uniref:Uncharacterized protein n=1 Tax=viral metagenome TaxID=1070528 RepID=A0A6C0CAF9_9ZZZZ
MAQVQQGEKTVEEMARMFNKLNESGMLEKLLEEARKKKGEVNEDSKEVVNEEPKSEKIDGVLKIEQWSQSGDNIVKVMQLTSSEDFAKIYNAKDKDLFAFDILEAGKPCGIIIEKRIISSQKIHKNLPEITKIDLSQPNGIRVIKVEKGLDMELKKICLVAKVNEDLCQTMKFVTSIDKVPVQTCLVRNSDLETFSTIDFIHNLKKDSKDKFYVIDSWVMGDINEKVIISSTDIRNIRVSPADRSNDKAKDITITHAMMIDDNGLAVEKHVLAYNSALDPKQTSYCKAIRVGTALTDSSYPILINRTGSCRLRSPGCQHNKKGLLSTFILQDQSEYSAAHHQCVIDESVFDALTFITPKNKEPHKTEYNKIYHYHTNNKIEQILIITASQFEEINNNTNTKYKGACIMTYFNVTNSNISEEITLTHTNWMSEIPKLVPIFKFDIQEKSKWLKGYILNNAFGNLKKGDFTFESKPAVFMAVLLEGKYVDCLITKEQLEKITSA